MKEMEQMIKEKGREQYYNYYRSLGYSYQTAAVLALFTYGQYWYRDLSIEDIYETLCRGEEYLPPEIRKEREEQKRWELEAEEEILGDGFTNSAFSSLFSDGFARSAAPSPSARRSSAARKAASAPASAGSSRSFSAAAGPAPTTGSRSFSAATGPAPAAKRSPGGNAPSFFRSLASRLSVSDAYFNEEEALETCASAPMERECSLKNSSPDLLGLAGEAGFSTDEYERIEEKDERRTAAEPTSTFRMTTNTASAGVILNQLRNGRRIDRSMVRIEEMLNYFRYESELPKDEMFRVSHELMDADDQRKYLYIHVQGKEEIRDRQNIVILLDVSGSMSGNAEETQAIIATIISRLGNGDKVSLVTYSTRDQVVTESFSIYAPDDRVRFLEKLLSIEINGCTNGSGGIESAYRIGKKNYIRGGNNQVILITDGDLNFGITDKGGLVELIEKKKKENLFLSVIGTGLYNYKDDKLETLSKHGNGVYRTVNNLADVKKSILEEYASLVNIIAKDVKAQVEFNPEVVESYRLLGFENRALSHEDFLNDRVISEPFGSGGYGIALYELKMKTGAAPAESGLKYSRLVTTGSQEPCTVKIRYKEPLADVSHELEAVIESADAAYTDNLRLAFIVYVCAEKLRGSDKISSEEINLARRLYTELGSAIREKNAADLYKLAGILDKSERELGIGIPERPFQW